MDGKVISIGYIDYDFNSIDSTALDRGALFFGEDSLLYDGEDDAYLTHRTTLPFVSTESVFGTDISFYFDPSLQLNNTGRQIEKIEVDLNTGEPLVLLPGAEGNLNIDGIMDSLIIVSLNLYFVGVPQPEIFVLEWRNGNMIPMGMSFDDDKCTSGNPILFSSGSSLSFKGYDEVIASQGKGEYVIFYRQINGSWVNCATDVRKPVIIIDGFDPKDERKITLFEDKPGIWDLLKYKNGTKHLGDSLRKLGYDVIVLNFPEYNTVETGAIRDGGADYIERNARVLVKLIQAVNDMLTASGSSEEIVVVGPSMGGQIARFALAYMEKQHSLSVDNMNHNTRLYVSFDSPHLGANISIGLQQALYFLGYKANQLKALDNYEDQLLSKAGRQMLIEQIDGLNKTSLFFQTYYNNKLINNGLNNSQGWPINLRKVALINGSSRGYLVNFAGEELLTGEARTTFNIKGMELNLKAMPNYNQQIETFSGIVRESKNFNGYFGLGYSFSIPFSNYLTTNLKQQLFFSQTVIGIYWAKLIKTYKGWYTTKNLNTNGSMDVVPGGTYDAIDFFKKEIDEVLDENDDVDDKSWFVNKKKHSFIPSVSALAFKNSNFNWSNSFNDRNLVCNNEIPFDNYFTAQTNEEHVHVSEAAANWIMEEIQYGQVNCPVVCATKINGTNGYLCKSTSYTFSLDQNVPSNASTVWSVPDGLTRTYESNNSITVIPETNTTESGGILKATITSKNINGHKCAADVILEKTIQFGKAYDLVFDDYGDPDTIHFDVAVMPHLAGNTYQWAMDNINFGSVTGDYEKKKLVKSDSLPAPFKYFKVKVYSEGCPGNQYQLLQGRYLVQGFLLSHMSSKLKGKPASVSPNPSSNYWILDLGNIFNEDVVNVDVFSTEGKQMKSLQIKNTATLQIPIADWPAGMYIIKIHNKVSSQFLKAVKF